MRFERSGLDPIGISKIWNKWVFYNDEEKCSAKPGTCLSDPLQIDGNEKPYTYTTLYTWEDFFNLQEMETLFWLMLGTSFVGVLASPIEFGLSLGLITYVSLVGLQGYYDVLRHPNSERYQFQCMYLLILSFIIALNSAFFMNIFILFPITGPVMNIVVMYVTLLWWKSLALPLPVTWNELWESFDF